MTTAVEQLTLSCPPDMRRGAQLVLDGEYDVPVDFQPAPTVVDVGANIGSFAIWASRRWPGCHLHCYEPMPDNLHHLRRNVTRFRLNAVVHPVAVTNRPGPQPMFRGRHNCGECSLHDLGEQRRDAVVTVDTLRPQLLPPAHVIKIDTEGCEREIIETIIPGHYVIYPVILFEYHADDDRRAIDALLVKHGYRILELRSPGWHRGTVKYLRA